MENPKILFVTQQELEKAVQSCLSEYPKDITSYERQDYNKMLLKQASELLAIGFSDTQIFETPGFSFKLAGHLTNTAGYVSPEKRILEGTVGIKINNEFKQYEGISTEDLVNLEYWDQRVFLLVHVIFLLDLYAQIKSPSVNRFALNEKVLLANAIKQELFIATNAFRIRNCCFRLFQAKDVQKDENAHQTQSNVSTFNQQEAGRKTRKPLKNQDSFMKLLTPQLPKGMVLGKAYDQGDCFFDALAQILNKINNTDVNTDHYLRRLCHDFYLQNEALVVEWNKHEFGGIENRDNYHFVQYTAEECEQDFNGRTPIWGRPNIEGMILCRQLNLEAICLIEILEDPETKKPVPSFHLVTKDAYKSIDETEAEKWLKNPTIPTIAVEQNSLHFVPLLDNAAVVQKQTVTQFGEHSQKVTLTEKFVQNFLAQAYDYFQNADDGSECVFPMGYKTHAMYLTLVKFEDTIIFRVDNLMENNRHKSKDGKQGPFYIAEIPIKDLSRHQQVKDYLKKVCAVLESEAKEAEEAIYTRKEFKFPLESKVGYPPLELQKVANCAYANYSVGLRYRLWSLGGTENTKVFNWLIMEALQFSFRDNSTQTYFEQIQTKRRKAEKSLLSSEPAGIPVIIDKLLSDEDVINAQALFVPVNGSHNFNYSNDRPLTEKLDTFLQSKKKVLLLLGNAGSGKTMFLQHFTINHPVVDEQTDAITLYISLPRLRDPVKNLINEVFKDGYNLSDEQILLLKKHRKFVFILDSYDEMKPEFQAANLYSTNLLKEWNAHVIIACRTQWLKRDFNSYNKNFMPSLNGRPLRDQYEEIHIVPFSQDKIQKYVKQYLAFKKNELAGEWSKFDTYDHHFHVIPRLLELIANPFILNITMEAMPDIVAKFGNKDVSERIILTTVDLYDAYIQRWFERQNGKLAEDNLGYADVDSLLEFENFSEKLAVAMRATGVTEVAYTSTITSAENKKWEEFFGLKVDKETMIGRKGCPLRKLDANHFAFIHTTIQEYFISKDGFKKYIALEEALEQARAREVSENVLKTPKTNYSPTLFSQSVTNTSSSESVHATVSKLNHDPQAVEAISLVETNNLAVKAFLGDKLNPSHLDFKTWYHPDVCHYLLQLVPNQAKCIRVIFSDADDNNTQTFKDQLTQLVMLGNTLRRPAIFISKEPGADNHFICGLVKENKLLLINPLGITTKSDCYQTIFELKKEGTIGEVWFSSNPLQKHAYEEEGLVSCGAVTLELGTHILSQFTSATLEQFWNQLKTNEPTTHEQSGLIYHGINIKVLLPETLQALEKADDKTSYTNQACSIHARHLQQLRVLPAQCAKAEKMATDDYLKKCKKSALAQVLFNMLVMKEKTIANMGELPEYQLFKQELNTQVTSPASHINSHPGIPDKSQKPLVTEFSEHSRSSTKPAATPATPLFGM